MRHTITYTFGSYLPPTVLSAIQTQLDGQVAKETIVQVKGRKIYTSFGRLGMIADYDKGVITMIDPKSQQFAVTAMATYSDKLAAAQKQMMPVMTAAMQQQVQQMLDNVRVNVKSDRTGRTATIQGIATGEHVTTIAIEMPVPAGPGLQMRLEMHQWTAEAAEMERVPQLKELALLASLPKTGMDPMEMMTKMMGSMPGMADKLRQAAAEMMKTAGQTSLRTEGAAYMPAMAMLAGSAGDQAFMTFHIELAELSSAPVPDSRFEVPADYQSATMEDLIALMLPPSKATPAPLPGTGGQIRAATPMPLTPPPLPPGVERIGRGVTAPKVIAKTEPSYTDEARAAKVQGTVVLNVIVGPDGVPQQVTVLRSLEPSLDRNAIETVRNTWRFEPAMKDGKPVAVQAQLEVSFRLM